MHYEAKADNAHFVAYLLSGTISDNVTDSAKAQIGYSGTPSIAVGEAFYREAAIALELMVKAVIAQKIEAGVAPQNVVKVRPTHDLPALWREASLPSLNNEDQRRLLLVKRILVWAGRYAAPKTDDAYYLEEAEDEKLQPLRPSGGPRFVKPLLFTWQEFDRLYHTAAEEFWKLRQEYA